MRPWRRVPCFGAVAAAAGMALLLRTVTAPLLRAGMALPLPTGTALLPRAARTARALS